MEAALYIVLMIGGLIFFHELGHYVLARLMGVHVVEFSIGFGPKLFTIRGKKRHPALPPTEFVIGALPIGGYVRMLGAEPGEDIADDIRDVALNFKPVWRRFLIAAAGPAFNLILPFIIFFIFGLLTTEKLPSVIGDVSPGTPAFDAGLRAGDRITGIDGEEVAYWHELLDMVEARPAIPTEIMWDRRGKTMSTIITPALARSELVPKLAYDEVGKIGIGPTYPRATIGVSADSVAAAAGLQNWDKIIAVNGVRPASLADALGAIEDAGASTVKVTVLRATPAPVGAFGFGLNAVLNVTLPAVDTASDADGRRGLFGSGCLAGTVVPGSPVARAGLRSGDRLISVDGYPCMSWSFVSHRLHQRLEKPVEIRFQHGAEPVTAATVEAMTVPWPMELAPDNKVAFFGLSATREIGIAPPIPIDSQIGYAAGYMVDETTRAIRGTVAVIGGLFTGKVSVKEGMAGPLFIGALAAKTRDYGAGYFFLMMAMLSVSLGLINLLPIPILDGGTIMFLAIEGIRRKPVSMRVRMIATYAGLAFIVILMVIVLRNDLERCWG